MKNTFLLPLLCALFALSSAIAQPAYSLKQTLQAPADTMSWGTLGSSCAVDGNRLVLGGISDSTAASRGGVVKIFDATTGALALSITSPLAQVDEQFGHQVALQGDRLIVTGRRSSGAFNAQGAVFVYNLDSATPATPVLTINNPFPSDSEFFGGAIALSGNRLVVGANNNDTGATNAGRVYVYDLAGATPATPVLSIDNPTPGTNEGFGEALGLDGNILVVSAISDDTSATDAGIAYVYDLGGATPATPVHTINNPDPLTNEYFGFGIAVSGTKFVVGSYVNQVSGVAAGSAYVYDLTSGTPTVPVHTIDNPSPVANVYFGASVALSGNRLVVSANRSNVGVGAQAGSAYVYDLAGATPTVPVQTLNNPAPATQDYFGYSVALSGTRVFIGAYQDDVVAPNSGAGYLYDMTSATPTVPVRTVSHAAPAAGNHFGQTVAMSGSLMAVGLPDDDQVGLDAGTVAIFEMNSATPGTPILVIDSIDVSLNARVGLSLALEGNILVVGAPQSFAGSIRGGQVYVFDLSSATPKTPILTLADPAPVLNDEFGNAVAISGSRIVVGARYEDTGAISTGSAYVFDMSSGTPTVPVHILNNPSPAVGDTFGTSVAISGTRVIVGAPYDDTGAVDAGSAYIYDLTSGTPTVPLHTLNNPTPGNSDIFGNAVVIVGNRVVVGSQGNTVGATVNIGSIHVYDLASGTPATPVRTIDHPNPVFRDFFGASISLSGDRLLVGAPGNDTGATDAGRAYVFDLASVTPATPLATLDNPSPAQADGFGTAVSILGSRIAVGIPNADLSGRDQGAVAVYGPPSNNADLAGLSLSIGTLSPAFVSATTSYSTTLPGGTSSMTVTATRAQAGASITVNGNAVTSGSPSGSLPLNFGANTLTIVVTAEDQTTTKTYTVNATVAGSGTLAFANSVFTVVSNAAGSTADIVVQRSVSNEGAISCTLSSTDGSATSPAQYTAQTSTAVSLANGVSEAHISIPIAASATTTTAKAFTISLADINSGASLGAPSTATVVILPPAYATDVVKPVATISTPANNASIVDTLPVAISGAATDNIGIAKVQVSINNGVSFTDASVTSIGGSSVTYTINVQPVAGVNSIKVRALDFKGNVSALASRTFTHLRTLTVGISGPANSGGVNAGFVPTSARQAGKSYSITATPKAGFVFDGWNVNNMAGTGITAAKAELPKLDFIMQPGLALTAKFITNPFTPSVTGDFSGLITASASQPSGGTVISNASTGLCTAKLTRTGALTGSIKIDGLALPITAICDNTGTARFGATRATILNLLRPGKSWLVLTLSADLSGATNRITGTLTEFNKTTIIAQSNITADRHHFNGTNSVVAASYVKSYTGRLKARASQGAGFTSHDYPQGDGYVTFTVKANGSVTGAGKLADDTAITLSGHLSQAKHWPIFQQLYSNKGCLAADAALDDTQTNTDATAMNMLWFRPFQNVQWYPYGWDEGIFIDMLASKYTLPPASVFHGLAATNPTTGNTDLKFTNGLLSADVIKFVNLTTANVLSKAPLNDASFTFTPAFATGMISGTFTHSDGTKPKWQGVLMQKGNNKGGHGYFMSSKPTVANYLGESGAMRWLAK